MHIRGKIMRGKGAGLLLAIIALASCSHGSPTEPSPTPPPSPTYQLKISLDCVWGFIGSTCQGQAIVSSSARLPARVEVQLPTFLQDIKGVAATNGASMVTV